jgi:hypothetical protein
VAVFVLILMLRHTFYDANAALKQSRQELLTLQPPFVADEENAALVYASVVAVPYAGPNSLDPRYILFRDGRLLERPEIVQYLQNNNAQLKLIHQAAAMPRCNWNLDYTKGFALPLPNLSRSRDHARLLALEARMKARAGDHAGAARDLAEILMLADQVETDSILICSLVACAIRSIAFSTLEAIVWWDPPHRAGDLRAYRLALGGPISPSAQYTRAMATERRFGLYTADQLATQQLPMSSLTNQSAPVLSLFIGAERDALDRTYKEMLDRRGKAMTGEELLQALDQQRVGSAILVKMLVPALEQLLSQFVRVEEHRRLAFIGLAYLEYRAVHDRDPATLDALRPAFLAELPVDENAGQPPHMRVDPAGILSSNPYKSAEKLPGRGSGLIRLYYFGKNKVDDGGMNIWLSDEDAANRRFNDTDDPVFRIPPADWKPDAWPAPEHLGAPPLQVPTAGEEDAQADRSSRDTQPGKNP